MKLAAMSLVFLAASGLADAEEPVIGGPCQGCEWVFVGLPAELESSARIAPVGEAGEPLIIEGQVRTREGAPAAGIIVYAYHTDATGIYPRGTTRHGRLRGWARSDDAGAYRFETIRPAPYPGGTEPQHVHMHVIEPGRATYTIDSVLFADDPLLRPERRSQDRTGRGGSGLTDPKRDENGVWHVRRDIILRQNVAEP